MKTILATLLVLTLLVLLATPATAVVTFQEDFSSNTVGFNMNVGPGVSGASFDFSGGNALTPAGRISLRTHDTDYSGVDFTFEATVTLNGACCVGTVPGSNGLALLGNG